MLIVRIGASAALPAYLYFAVVGITLVAIDLATKKLPDWLTMPSYPVLATLLYIAGAESGHLEALARAVAAALLVLAFILAAVPFGMGLGDAKLAGLVGLVLGFRGWIAVYDGTLAAFVLASVVVAARAAHGRIHHRIPFGPFLVSGPLLVILMQHRPS
jgi:leader peptidase (prepilin peptidase) / N-methyltransferase